MNCSDMGCARRIVDNTVKEEAPVEEVKEETKDPELNYILASDETDEDLKEESEKTEEKEGE